MAEFRTKLDIVTALDDGGVPVSRRVKVFIETVDETLLAIRFGSDDLDIARIYLSLNDDGRPEAALHDLNDKSIHSYVLDDSQKWNQSALDSTPPETPQ